MKQNPGNFPGFCDTINAMRKFLYLLIIGAVVYYAVYQVPQETKERALAAIGLADFFQETLPRYLREKLSIPENPVVKRQQLLDQLSSAIGNIERELEVVSPAVANGAPAPTLPPPKTIREQIEKTRDFLAQSETVLEDLQKANPGQGIFQKTAERVLDKILPASVSDEASIGVGGDASGGVSERRCP